MTQIRKTILLEDNDEEIIKDCMNQIGIKSQSEFIRLLVRNFNESRDIDKDIRIIDFEKNELINKIKSLEGKEKELKETSKLKEKENIEKEDQIKKVIEILKRKIKEGKTIIEQKDCAKYWAFKLGIGIDSLIVKANKEIEDEKT